MQKVIFFDLDGTLTPQPTWLALNMKLGISIEEDKDLFEKYLKEKLAYRDWIDALMLLYKRNSLITKDELVALAQDVVLRPDAQGVVNDAKAKGYTVAIISGSIDSIVATIAQKLGIDIWFSKSTVVFNENNEFINIETMVGDERDGKLKLVGDFCEKHGVDIKEIICVEDGGNGLELFKHAKGILLGDNKELAPYAWKQVESLSEIPELL